MTVDVQLGPGEEADAGRIVDAVRARSRAVRDAFAEAVDAAIAAGVPFEVKLSDVEGAT